ncbi:hypothetical protein EV189_3366 [Motilibacter rhizosphaerae]|uniref:EcsC family protein n=1 Tax=Motilibacter rhizosphaerae TaxID=598652 RepID=A0A4Q7NGX0_9ACTN|nr:hypothetical protein [Motilibacter rhizosphaerae]RZS82968.1 hypothetical protein EV189_3366 [Motilibacter rhizosphaerae]
MRLTKRASRAEDQPRVESPDEQHGDGLPERLARLAGSQSEDRGERARQLADVAGALAGSARQAGGRAVVGGRWLVDTLLDVAPRLPLRDRETLRAHHPGLDDRAIAAALVRGASRTTGLLGAAGGAVAAASWAAPPSLLLSGPVELAAETLAVAAVEVKLVAELHALHGVVPRGTAVERTQQYVSSWAQGRGIDPTDPKWMASTLGTAAKAQIRKRMMGRAARGVTTLGPLLSGAAAGALVNSKATRGLAARIQEDLEGKVWRAGS